MGRKYEDMSWLEDLIKEAFDEKIGLDIPTRVGDILDALKEIRPDNANIDCLTISKVSARCLHMWRCGSLKRERTGKSYKYFLASPPVATYWMYTSYPEAGPHQSDTLNGYIYRILAVKDGVPHHAGSWVEARFRDEYDDNWSWGLCGIKTKTAFEAEKIARNILGKDFKGFVK